MPCVACQHVYDDPTKFKGSVELRPRGAVANYWCYHLCETCTPEMVGEPY